MIQIDSCGVIFLLFSEKFWRKFVLYDSYVKLNLKYQHLKILLRNRYGTTTFRNSSYRLYKITIMKVYFESYVTQKLIHLPIAYVIYIRGDSKPFEIFFGYSDVRNITRMIIDICKYNYSQYYIFWGKLFLLSSLIIII